MEILNRKFQIESIKGKKKFDSKMEKKKEEYMFMDKNVNTNSFKNIFQKLGLHDFNEHIGYHIVEQVLVTFRHSIKSRITEEQIELILNDFKSIMSVDLKSKKEKKKISIKKAVNILSWK